jgi:VanZ family protein
MRLFWLAILVFWCIAIYYFTEQPVFNDEHTLRFFYIIGLPETMIKITDFIVRKLAHVALFFTLAFFALNVVRHWRWQYLAAWVFASVYGMTDEWHQLYVPGRSGKVGDVIIDAAGALILIAVVYLWDKLHQDSKT